MRDLSDYSLKSHNTFGIDARCRRFFEYETVEEAVDVAELLGREDSPFIIIGGGSNLLLTRDFDGIVVHSAIKGYETDGTLMTCGSGMTWDDVVKVSLDSGLYGAENLSHTPHEIHVGCLEEDTHEFA